MSGTEIVQQRGPRARVDPKAFYRSALSASEEGLIAVADEVVGLDQEIAMLRVRLRRALEEHPEDMTLMAKGVDMLVKALAAGYKLSKGAKADISASIQAVLDEYGPMIGAEAQGDVVAGEGE